MVEGLDRRTLEAILGEDVPKEEAMQLGYALFDEVGHGRIGSAAHDVAFCSPSKLCAHA